MSNVNYLGTHLDSVKLTSFGSHSDCRGEFHKIYSENKILSFDEHPFNVKQANFSRTLKSGTIRGMHFQKTYSEAKIIRCIRGSVFDVAVDIRPSSKNYLKWMGVILSEDNQLSVIIPAGFAHGFQAMQDNCELIYLHSEEYNQSAEFGVKYNDPILDIKWPLPCTKTSSRDEAFEYIKNLPSGLI